MLRISKTFLLQLTVLVGFFFGSSILACSPNEGTNDVQNISQSVNIQFIQGVKGSLSHPHSSSQSRKSIDSSTSQSLESTNKTHNCECCGICSCSACAGCTSCPSGAIPLVNFDSMSSIEINQRHAAPLINFTSLNLSPPQHPPQ